MKIEFFVYHNKRNWKKYLNKITWMNCITWEKGLPKLYRWFIFGIAITK